MVVPHLLARPDFLVRREELADNVGAEFFEIVLWGTRDNALRRFAAGPPRPEHHHETDPGEAAVRYDRLEAFPATRPHARLVHPSSGRVDDAYRAFLTSVA